jgi:hypothetical protein
MPARPLCPTRPLLAALFLLAAAPALLRAQSFTRITDPSNPVVTDVASSGGGSWADVDGDGDLDLFVPNGNVERQDDALYLNDGAGGFIRAPAGPVTADGGPSIGGTFADVNKDGYLDLFVTNRENAGNVFYLGGAGGTFTPVTSGDIAADRASSNSSSWVDVDTDGDLDLFVVNFTAEDFLYLNDGAPGYTFTRNRTVTFLGAAAESSIPGAWADVDNDRDPDLFVGNAGAEHDYLYRNEGALAFTRTVLADGRATLGASWGDYDNDGDLDLFAANFLGQDNLLYRNSGPPGYTLAPIAAGPVTGDGGRSVGSGWGDYDNDGDLDLFVANDRQNNFLYTNSGPPAYTFTKVITGPVVEDGGASFGAAWGDLDNDGDLDLFVANQANQANFLYRNDTAGGAWLSVNGLASPATRTALGARVKVKATIRGVPVWQMRELAAQTGYNSQNLTLHFGLGDATRIDTLRVEWPAGTDDVFTNVAVNQIVYLAEGAPFPGTRVAAESAPALPAAFALAQNYPNPFGAAATTLGYTLAHPARVALRVYDVHGRTVKVLFDGLQAAGLHAATWDGTDAGGRPLPPGLYVCALETPAGRAVRKMVLLR